MMTAPHHPNSLKTMPQPIDNISRALAYALDPVLWSRDVVGWTPDPWQASLLHSQAHSSRFVVADRSGKVRSSPCWHLTPPSLMTTL